MVYFLFNTIFLMGLDVGIYMQNIISSVTTSYVTDYILPPSFHIGREALAWEKNRGQLTKVAGEKRHSHASLSYNFTH